MLRLLDEQNVDYKLFTGRSPINTKSKFLNKVLVFVNYLRFLLSSAFTLASTKCTVLYYESISALPVVICNRLFPNRPARLFIHFHEYFSEGEYQKQSYLSRMGRKYEKSLFDKANWISHTNSDRLRLFKKDIDVPLNESILKVLPNYPSKYWNSLPNTTKTNKSDKIRFLHIGSISFEGLYLKELLLEFGNDDTYELHFYSHSTDTSLINWLKQYDNVFYHGSIDYNDIPKKVYGKYDIGLVLYKGNSLNFTYNAPNKIFEYLALDLDVWCSKKLLTAHNFETKETFPKVVLVDFQDLQNINIPEALDMKGLRYEKSSYFYEEIYLEFIEHLKTLGSENN
jgi:hypothetical protein